MAGTPNKWEQGESRVPDRGTTIGGNPIPEGRLQAFLDSLPHNVAVLDPRGRILFVNASWRQFSESNGGRSDFVGVDYLSVCEPRGSDTPACPEAATGLHGVLEGRLPEFSLEYPCHSPDEKRWFLMTVAPVRDRVGGAVVSHIDITDRHLLEERLQDSNAELAQFAYAVSHDLQAPLNSVSGFLGLLRNRYAGRLDAKAQEYIGFAIDGARRMSAMIRDLLEYSRLQTVSAERVSCSCDELVAVALGNFSGTIDQQQAEIQVSGPLPVVEGNANALTRLFQNLIGNALKYRHPDRAPRILVSAERQGAEWAISVADNGRGIEPRHFGKIFEVFSRLETQDSVEGTGIGLALVKRIADRHGGRISVASVPGEGSTFTVYLPA